MRGDARSVRKHIKAHSRIIKEQIAKLNDASIIDYSGVTRKIQLSLLAIKKELTKYIEK